MALSHFNLPLLNHTSASSIPSHRQRNQKAYGMSFLSSIRTSYLAWSHSTPLPALPDTPPPAFQHWHNFDEPNNRWAPIHPNAQTSVVPETSMQAPKLKLLTWNIDAFGDRHEARVEGVLSKIQQMHADDSGPDVVFFQEVSRKALACLLQNAWVRKFWVSSEVDETNWANVSFATVTLLARSRFGVSRDRPDDGPLSPTSDTSGKGCFSLGPVWRVNYPSRFDRDALCCDVFWNRTTRVRLVNVHLDSLPIQPNMRPKQVAIAASFIRMAEVGRGIIAGDWNTVTEEDLTLAEKNSLDDAWECLRPAEDGFTWGIDGAGDPFPPGRLDRIAVLGIRVVDINVVHPETLPSTGDESGGELPWSDHSGVVCSFVVGGLRD